MAQVKKIFVAILFCLWVYQTEARILPDTIDNWSFYQKNNLLQRFNAIESDPLLILDLVKSKAANSLTVQFSCDTPCASCVTQVAVYDDSQKQVIIASGKNSRQPITFTLEKIIDRWNSKTSKYFLVYYLEPGRAKRILLAKLVFK